MTADRPTMTKLKMTGDKLPDLPIKVTLDQLTQTEGRGLMQNARGTRKLVEAVMFVLPWVHRWGDDYAQAKADYLLNMSISMDGEGRKELVSCLDAGGQIPEGYYSDGRRNGFSKDTAYIRESE